VLLGTVAIGGHRLPAAPVKCCDPSGLMCILLLGSLSSFKRRPREDRTAEAVANTLLNGPAQLAGAYWPLGCHFPVYHPADGGDEANAAPLRLVNR